MTSVKRIASIEPEYHHGIEVLRLHVDDPIPTPRAPQRFAVLVHPDLARYLLTFNHPNNRNAKKTAIAKYARDMAQGFWAFTPEGLLFSTQPYLEDGQNRLHGVIESGARVWMMCDFGWPADLISVVNRGSSRTNADAFSANGIKNASAASSAIGMYEKYRLTVGRPNLWTTRLLTPSESIERFNHDPDGWTAAAEAGGRVYLKINGLGATTWAAAFYAISEAAGREVASAFFNEVAEGTGEPGSATRRLSDHYRNRKLGDTASGDKREPIENIIRSFNAWQAGKPVGLVRQGGAFILSPVKSR